MKVLLVLFFQTINAVPIWNYFLVNNNYSYDSSDAVKDYNDSYDSSDAMKDNYNSYDYINNYIKMNNDTHRIEFLSQVDNMTVTLSFEPQASTEKIYKSSYLSKAIYCALRIFSNIIFVNDGDIINCD